MGWKATRGRVGHSFQPKFGEIPFPLNMDMSRLARFIAVEKEPVGAGSQNGRHVDSLSQGWGQAPF